LAIGSAEVKFSAAAAGKQKALLAMMPESSDLGKPWFSQLMARPQLYV